MYRLRDKQITDLVGRIQGNWEKIDQHVQTRTETIEEIGEKVDEIQYRMTEAISL